MAKQIKSKFLVANSIDWIGTTTYQTKLYEDYQNPYLQETNFINNSSRNI
jgi:hypothetical protein